jgi:hypothetical protein
VDLDRAAGGVALDLGMFLGGGDEVVTDGVSEVVEAVKIVGREFDCENVGDHRAAVRDDGGAVVHGSADGAGDFDGLHFGAERLGEGALDRLLDPALELVE